MGHLGAMLSHLGVMLGDLGAMLGLCWAILGPCWAHFGPSWGLCWAYVGSWAILEPCWAYVGPSWGPSWAYVGPMLAQACPYLSLMLTHVAHILADVGPMLAPRPSRTSAETIFCDFFRPSKQKLWKNPHFLTSPRCNSAPPRGPKPCKKRCFLNTTRRIHCKLQR